ncbi:MAG: hypothetical protein JWO06_1225 [Bacteroidota bacterium]|nr:hypothetical protein [Bacteroidota bacterium]
MSGYQDSNLGPPAPKAGALTGLRYTPNCFIYFKSFFSNQSAVRAGFEPAVPFNQYGSLANC